MTLVRSLGPFKYLDHGLAVRVIAPHGSTRVSIVMWSVPIRGLLQVSVTRLNERVKSNAGRSIGTTIRSGSVWRKRMGMSRSEPRTRAYYQVFLLHAVPGALMVLRLHFVELIGKRKRWMVICSLSCQWRNAG
jgi:hypothetical protein